MHPEIIRQRMQEEDEKDLRLADLFKGILAFVALLLFVAALAILFSGCASTGGKASSVVGRARSAWVRLGTTTTTTESVMIVTSTNAPTVVTTNITKQTTETSAAADLAKSLGGMLLKGAGAAK